MVVMVGTCVAFIKRVIVMDEMSLFVLFKIFEKIRIQLVQYRAELSVLL